MGSTSQYENIFRILIATDNHLGYAEKDSERSNDTFTTFEEILKLAVEHKVDFILLGGDLFHENKPSRHTVIKCMDLLRKYTLGDKPVEFEFLSDPAVNFPLMKNPTVNYLDPNLNVAIPVFSIHGNHDDPTGKGQLCALDMLSTAGLVNYFGRCSDLREIVINPILLQKGNAKLALYGLSAIKDERLFRLFNEKKVTMLRPKESVEEWCNLMVVHQNHAEHGPTNYLPESFLDDCLDLVIWGHEHECLLNPTSSKSQNFFVTQPGSSVATSLCKGESKEKHVGILEVTTEKSFRMIPLPLKTVRPLMFDNVCLADHDIGPVENESRSPVEEFVTDYVNDMINKAKDKLTGDPMQPVKPLIRLRVEYSHDSQVFNVARFGHSFIDQVANPSDMILFKRQRQGDKKSNDAGLDQDVLDAIFQEEDIHEQRVEDLVENYFANLDDENHKLQLLTERGLARAVTSFVEKDDKDAIEVIIKHQIEKLCKHLGSMEELEEDDIEIEIMRFKQERLNRFKEEEEREVEQMLNSQGRTIQRTEDSDMEFDDDSDTESTTSSRGRGSRGTAGRARGRGRGRGRGSPSSKSELEMTTSSSTTRGRGRGRGRGRAANQQSSRSIMESFANRSTSNNSNTSKRKGVSFDSDSD